MEFLATEWSGGKVTKGALFARKRGCVSDAEERHLNSTHVQGNSGGLTIGFGWHRFEIFPNPA